MAVVGFNTKSAVFLTLVVLIVMVKRTISARSWKINNIYLIGIIAMHHGIVTTPPLGLAIM
jgi:hypothetical protein